MNTINVQALPQDEALLLALKTLIDEGVDALQNKDTARAIAALERALKLAPERLPAHDIASHNILIACKQGIIPLLEQGEFAAADPLLHRAFELQLRGPLAQDPTFRRRFADTYYDLGKAFYTARCWEAALVCARRAIEIQPCPSYYVDLTNALAFTKSRARLVDYTRNCSPEQLGKHLFVACAPKSGSTFLKNLLTDLTQYKDVFSVYAGLQNEQELDLPQLAEFARLDKVTQQHCRASEANIHLMQAFGIRPVVLVRDIYDTVMSLLDFYDGGFVYSTYFERDEYIKLSESERLDLLIEFVVPWYFQFVASWQRAERDGRLEVLWLSYDELTTETTSSLQRILAFYGMTAQVQDLERIIEMRRGNARSNRLNRGVRGRGQTGLTDAQRQRISHFGRFFPEANFSCLGIGV